jgi:hypothetical protein
MAIPADLQQKAQKAAVMAKLLKEAASKGIVAGQKLMVAQAAEANAANLGETARKSEAASTADASNAALVQQARADAAAAEQARADAAQLRSEAEEAQMETEALYKASRPDAFKMKMAEAFTNLGTWILLCVGAIVGVIIWAVSKSDSILLTKLAETDAARGLVTFLISASAVGIAFMLIYHAFSAVSNGENFRMAREIFMSLVGILGTIVGFYFGTADKGQEVPAGDAGPSGLEMAAIVREGDNWKTSVKGGSPPYKWTLAPAPITGLTGTDGELKTAGELRVSVKGAKEAGEVILTVEDSNKERVSRSSVVNKAGQ